MATLDRNSEVSVNLQSMNHMRTSQKPSFCCGRPSTVSLHPHIQIKLPPTLSDAQMNLIS